MYTKKALRALGVTQATLTDDQKRQLDEQGFFTVENVLSEPDLAVMRAEFERLHGAEQGQGGHEVHVEPGARRLSNIFNKTAAFDRCLEIPEVLAAAAYLLGRDQGAWRQSARPGPGLWPAGPARRRAEDVRRRLVGRERDADARRHDARQRPDPRDARLAPLGADQRALRQPGRLGAGAARPRGPGARAGGPGRAPIRARCW